MPDVRTVETCVYTLDDPKSWPACRDEIHTAQAEHADEACTLEITGTDDHSLKKLTLMCEGRAAPLTAARRGASSPQRASGQRIED